MVSRLSKFRWQSHGIAFPGWSLEKIEYAVDVSKWLRGSLDYFIPGAQNLLSIEAKQADLARGFVQLGAELIALDQWTTSDQPLLYGAITTGDV